MGITDIFTIIDIIINYQKCDEIIENSKEEFVNAKSEHEVNGIIINYKKLINKWYKRIILKSIFILLAFILLIILFYIICNYFNVFSIFLAVASLIIIAGISIVVYILDKINNKTKIINELYKKLENISYNYKPIYDKIRVY